MKTTTETEYIYGSDWYSLDSLIERLQMIKAKTNQSVNVSIGGSINYGYTISCSWERPMTEEEIQRRIELSERAEHCSKEMRRKQYEELRKEFENGES